MIYRFVFLLVLVLAVAAQAQTVDDHSLSSVASALTKLARAVDAYVADDPVSAATLQSDELLRVATRHDPGLLHPFKRFAVRARAEGRNSSVLVCTADGQRGLIEDAGCTARSDLQLWRSVQDASCHFFLDLVRICGP